MYLCEQPKKTWMQIFSEFPLWYMLLCLMAGGVAAFVLYWRNRANSFSRVQRITLVFIRLLSVTLVASLLLSPLFLHVLHSIERPLLIFAQDNSSSIVQGADSNYLRTQYPASVKKMKEAFKEKYDVELWQFSREVQRGVAYSFDGTMSNMSALIEQLNEAYYRRNVGAVIIATDGCYNVGENPEYVPLKLNCDLFTIALGDTVRRVDAGIKNVFHNQLAYLGNNFPVEVDLSATLCDGEILSLSVVNEGKVMVKKNIEVKGDKFSSTQVIELTADKVGLQGYSVLLSPALHEKSLQNNQINFVVEVMDSKRKILMVYDAPHPDLAALRGAIERNKNYEITLVDINHYQRLKDSLYDLVILHQLPSIKHPIEKLISQYAQQQTPLWIVLGANSSLSLLNKYESGMLISSEGGHDEVTALINKDFSLFVIPDEVSLRYSNWSPLSVPYGDYNTATGAEVLFYQQVGNIATSRPLLVFNQDDNRRGALLAGEGMWRWPINEYRETGATVGFDKLISQVVQYLSIRDDKRKFRITQTGSFADYESVEFTGELYNDAYELVNSPEVTLVVTDEQQQKYPRIMEKNNKGYSLNIGSLPHGRYTYHASVKFGQHTYNVQGVFFVEQTNAEHNSSIANHTLLYRLAKQYGGDVIYPDNLDQFTAKLLSREDIVPLIREHKRMVPWNDLWPVLLIIIGLFSAEWSIRKYAGSY